MLRLEEGRKFRLAKLGRHRCESSRLGDEIRKLGLL